MKLVKIKSKQAIKHKSTSGDTLELEKQIDEMIYDLYDLSREEREIVKGS